MFKIMLVCALAALVAANENADVVRLVSEVNPDGFRIESALSDGSAQEATGDVHGNIHGSFEWVSKEGEHIRVQYVADENGYQPQSDILPTPPPVPEAISRALQWIATHPSKDAH
ncbi:larval cuticle protein III/IV-like [Drosophila tropicalis]|uniref:larval cuticle protein III/IV-like n=1 Tax=Drosophila tropicalis TaxID=46794 RepID=UPI0035AB829D